ncbi:hypothetical protein APHAL10511_006928 [Amanita phalloides]|nr:hypothetical protein APHAL10511_006928 [Amanita phalloides]
MEDTTSTYSKNAASSSLSLFITSSPLPSCPQTPLPSFSRSSSPAWNDNLRSSPFTSSPSTIPLPESRACSPHPPTAWSTNLSRTAHSREYSPIRSSEFYSGRWISQSAKKRCSDPLLTSSPLRAPPMLPVMDSSASSASSLSKASGFSYATNASTSTAPTSIVNSPIPPNVEKSFSPVDVVSYHRKRSSTGSSCRASVLQYRSLSDSISEAYDKLCDKLKKSLRVMWKQGKRYEVNLRVEHEVAEAEGTVDTGADGATRGTKVNENSLGKLWKRTSVEGVGSVETSYRERTDSNATSAATDSESPIKQSKRESAEVRNLDKAYRQRKDSSTTGTEFESPIKHWKRKSAESIRILDKACRQRLDSLTKATDTTIDAPPPYNKVMEKNLPSVSEIADFMDLRDPFACHSSGSPQVIKNTASVLPPPSSSFQYSKIIEARKRKKRAASGSDRPGSAGRGSVGSRSGSAGSASFVGRSRSRRTGGSATARRLRPMIPKRTADAKSSQVVGSSKGCVNPKLASPAPNTLVSVASAKVPNRLSTPTPNFLATPLFVPFSVSLPAIDSSSHLPTPPLTPSSPISPDCSPSLPSTPVSTRKCSLTSEIRHAKSQPNPLPPRISLPLSDGRAWI